MKAVNGHDVVSIYLSELEEAASALREALDLLDGEVATGDVTFVTSMAAEQVALARQNVLHVQTLALPALGAWMAAGQAALDQLRAIASVPAWDLACETVTAADLVLLAGGAVARLDSGRVE